MKDYDIYVLYHTGKANVVVNARSRLSMGSIAYVKDSKNKLAQEFHHFSRLGFHLFHLVESSIWVQNRFESFLVSKVKEKKDRGLSLVKLKKSVRDQKVEVFSQEVDGVLHCQGRLCIPGVDDLRK